MCFNRLIVNLVVIASLSLMPLLANAHPLSIVNHTDSQISFTVDNNCSEEIGTVKVVGVKNISEDTLNKLCLNYSQPCAIIAHNGDHCSGKSLGGMTYNSEHEFVIKGSPNSDVSISATEDRIVYTSPIRH